MTRKLKFITILVAGTSVTATGLGVGLDVGLKIYYHLKEMKLH